MQYPAEYPVLPAQHPSISLNVDTSGRFPCREYRESPRASVGTKCAFSYVSTNGRNVPSSSCGEVEFASADTAYVLAERAP